jgi:von Willebrand factor type A domain
MERNALRRRYTSTQVVIAMLAEFRHDCRSRAPITGVSNANQSRSSVEVSRAGMDIQVAQLPALGPWSSSFALFVSLAAIGGCSSSSAASPSSVDTGFPGGSGSSNPSGGGGPMLVLGTSGAGNDASVSAGSGGIIVIDDQASCATDTLKAEPTPVNMFIQFDRSGSMNQNNKWPLASNALNSFFKDPKTAGLAVALRFFPDEHPVPGCTRDATTGGSCDAAACSMPLVPLGKLQAEGSPADVQEQALLEAVTASAPPPQGPGDGGTPMYAALAGALNWAVAHQTATPKEKTIVVLVTDGSPTGCIENMNQIASLASDALQSSGVLTYVIGIEGASERQVNQIAAAGGTTKAFLVGAVDADLQLIEALNTIRGTALSCDLAVPIGNNVDFDKVNVKLSGATATSEYLARTTGATNCDAGGWYYDDPISPKQIKLCPTTCDRVQAQASAQVDIVLGCAVVEAPPPK